MDSVLSYLPAVNATLNFFSAVFLAAGYMNIRRKRILAHRACMITAFVLSVLFLICYVIYHAMTGVHHFQGTGWLRPAYFTILGTHTVLAAGVPFLAVTALVRAHRGQFARHRAIARVTLPIWLYVSITGVIVYWMLYRL